MKYKTKFNYKRNEYYVYYDMDNDHVCIVYVSVHEGNANNEADRLNGIERLNEGA